MTWPGADFLATLRRFESSNADVLVVVQCDREWLSSPNRDTAMEFEYQLSRLCVGRTRPLAVTRLVPHDVGNESAGQADRQSNAAFFGRWSQAMEIWGRLVDPACVDLQILRLIDRAQTLPDTLQWSLRGKPSRTATLAARIRSSTNVTPVFFRHTDIHPHSFDLDPSESLA